MTYDKIPLTHKSHFCGAIGLSEEENTETQMEQQPETTETASQPAAEATSSDIESSAASETGAKEANAESTSEVPKETLILGDFGEIIWNDETIAKVTTGNAHLEPKFEITREELNRDETRDVVTERLSNWLEDMLHTDLFPLFRLKSAIEHVAPEANAEVAATTETVAETTEAPAEAETAAAAPVVHTVLSDEAKVLAQKLLDSHGILNRAYVEKEVAALSQEVRKSLRVLGIRFGRSAVYFPLLLKPKAVRLNAILGYLSDGAKSEKPFLPPIGVTSFEADETRTEKEYDLIGFRNIAGRSIRIDILDRVLDVLYEAQKEAKGAIPMPQSVVSFLGVSNEIAEKVVETLGWVKSTDEEGKVLWQFKRPKPPQKTFKPRPQTSEGGNREFKRPDQNFGGKKRKDNKGGGKPKGGRDYSSGPKRNDGDSPFAILASLKLGDKKE